MFIFLFNVCRAIVVVQKQASSYSNVKTNGESVTISTAHGEDVTQAGADIQAHQFSRKLTRKEIPGQVKTWHSLVKQAGVKNGQDATTRMIKAMGFGEQLPGRPVKGQLNVKDAYNVSGPIAGIEFKPDEQPQEYAGQIFCDDGRCQSAGHITETLE